MGIRFIIDNFMLNEERINNQFLIITVTITNMDLCIYLILDVWKYNYKIIRTYYI